MTQIGKLRRTKSGQASKEFTERQHWIWNRFQFLLPHIGQVTKRNVQSLKAATTLPDLGDPEDNDQDVDQQEPTVTTPPLTTTPSSTITTASTSRGGKGKGRGSAMEQEDDFVAEMASSKERQEKLLQILQTPLFLMCPFQTASSLESTWGMPFSICPCPSTENSRTRCSSSSPMRKVRRMTWGSPARQQRQHHLHQHQQPLDPDHAPQPPCPCLLLVTGSRPTHSKASGSQIRLSGPQSLWVLLVFGSTKIHPGWISSIRAGVITKSAGAG